MPPRVGPRERPRYVRSLLGEITLSIFSDIELPPLRQLSQLGSQSIELRCIDGPLLTVERAVFKDL